MDRRRKITDNTKVGNLTNKKVIKHKNREEGCISLQRGEDLQRNALFDIFYI